MSSIQPSRLFAAGGRSVCVCVGGGGVVKHIWQVKL